MAAQSVGHMDEARPWTGGGQWFAHLVSATVAFSSGSCANGAPWARTISLVGRWAQIKLDLSRIHVARGFATAMGCTRRPGVLRTWPDTCHSPPPRRPGFSLGGLPIRDVGGCKAPAFAPPHPRGWGAFRAPPSPPGACPRLKPTPPLPLVHILTCPVPVAWQVNLPLHHLHVLPRLVLHFSSSSCCWSGPQARACVLVRARACGRAWW